MTRAGTAGSRGDESGDGGVGRRAVLGWTGAALGVGVVTACTSTVDWSEPTVASATPTPPATVTELLGTEGFMVAHRGGSRSWPEMTEVAYDYAVEERDRMLDLGCRGLMVADVRALTSGS